MGGGAVADGAMIICNDWQKMMMLPDTTMAATETRHCPNMTDTHKRNADNDGGGDGCGPPGHGPAEGGVGPPGGLGKRA